MKTVYKYQLDLNDINIIRLPRDYQLLCVQMQFNTPCIWALVEPENEPVERKVRIVGTGHPFPDEEQYTYLGTITVSAGVNALWLHVFVEVVPLVPLAV